MAVINRAGSSPEKIIYENDIIYKNKVYNLFIYLFVYFVVVVVLNNLNHKNIEKKKRERTKKTH